MINGTTSTERFDSVIEDGKPNSFAFQMQIKNEFKELNGVGVFASDVIYAKYKNVNYRQGDVEIKSVGNNDSQRTYFRGVWMRFEFEQKFAHNLRVIAKGSNKYAGVTKANNMKKVRVEDAYFDNNFDTYSDNELNTFCLLKPQLIERMNNVAKKGNSKVSFGFTGEKLHISINNNKNTFEPSIFKQNSLENLQEEMNLVIDIINELRLNNLYFA